MRVKKLLSASILVLACTLFGASSQVSALSGNDFKPGNIIDDATFFNSQAMSASDIQNFLNSKVPVCDTNGTQMYNGMTRAEYGASRGNPAPYTCLKDYSGTTNTVHIFNHCSSVSGGQKTAAQIIAEVGVACGINPQVLLTLIQVNSSLVTNDWPWVGQYGTATGYGCPGAGLCHTSYQYFFHQMMGAASLLKGYSVNNGSYAFKPFHTTPIQFNANASCGSAPVYIENQATANLYNYTPYQPNQVALSNLNGVGDSCSSYGNRNFWKYFNEWFGSPVVEPLNLWALITVNNQANVTVDYGGSVLLKWNSENVQSCTVTPGNFSGTTGTQTLVNLKTTTEAKLNCTGDGGSVSSTSAIQVKPATFSYLKTYLKSVGNKNSKPKIRTDHIVNQVEKAEKKLSKKTSSEAKEILNKSVDSMKELVKKEKIPASVAQEYALAVKSLIRSWDTPVASVNFSTDGCKVTAKAPAGSKFEVGAYTELRGASDTMIVPESGTAESTMGNDLKDWTSFGKLWDANGVLLVSGVATITKDECQPTPVEEPEPVANGGYPSIWADVPKGSVIDNWGMYNRESTSYAAFKVSASGGRQMPYWGGRGNANQWDDNARQAGIPVDTTPVIGDVAISNAGYYGHAMYVEAVNSDGTIKVSEYNVDGTGVYSERTLNPTGLVFIHFPYAISNN